MLNVLTALLLCVAAPTMANGVVIEGVSEGQVVRGELKASAVSSDHRLTDLLLILSGPDGVETLSRSGTNRVHLVYDPQDPSRGLAWDADAATPGAYTLAAYSTSRQRTGRKVNTAVVNFTVENNNVPVTPVAPVVPEAPAADPVVEQPAPATPPTADTVSPEEPTQETQEVSGVSTPEPDVTPTAPVLQPAPLALASDPTIAFAAGTLTERTLGDADTIRIDLTDPVDGSDVLVLVWDLDRKEVVSGVSAVLPSDGNLVVPASLLNNLPAGNMELQAHYRENDAIVQTAKHILVNREATVEPAPSGRDAMPAFSFPANTPDTYTVGSNAGLSFDVDGELPGSGDVLAIAWSIDDSELVAGFAQVLDEAPWTISSEMMGLLPQGRVEIQLRPRYNGAIIGKVVHVVDVTRQTVADLPTPTDPTDGEGDGSANPDTPDADAVADVDTPGDPVDAGDPPVADATPDAGAPPAVPTENVNIDVQFASDAPTRYIPGSGEAIDLELDGTLPAGADVLMLMWHKDRSEMIESFSHELTGPNPQVSTAKLDAVPFGRVELQALLRIPGQALEITRRSMIIVDPDNPDDPQYAENNNDSGGNTNYDDLNLSSDGFTRFTKSADTRVIYVAANGSDNNDGLSPSKPMRTASAAYKKLRDGKPDWLLFKAGDTFRGNLGVVNKSGRSASEPMLISTYGEGPRPIFLSPNSDWAIKYFQNNADHVAFVGLHIIAENRDPNRSGFKGRNMSKSEWNASAITFLGDARDVLVEDCIAEYFKFALVFQSNKDNGYIRDIKVRRNAVLYSYGHWDKNVAGHSSGIFVAYADGLLVEENVWHHNGWTTAVSGAGKTKFNHNMYQQDNCTGNSVVRGNIFSWGAAHGLQLRSGGDIIDNLFVGNPLAFFTGRYESDVLRNVILKSQDIGDEARGHGFEILPCLFARVENNIVSQKQGSAGFAYGIGFNYSEPYSDFLNGRPFRVTIKDNKIYRWPRSNGSALRFGTKPTIVEEARNALDKASGGDTDPPWIDPERDVESYMQSIGQKASLDALIEAAAYRPRGQWVEEFSAEAINLYIRRGFDVRPFD